MCDSSAVFQLFEVGETTLGNAHKLIWIRSSLFEAHERTTRVLFRGEIVETAASRPAVVTPDASIVYMYTGNTSFHSSIPLFTYKYNHSLGKVDDHYSLRTYLPQLSISYALHVYLWYTCSSWDTHGHKHSGRVDGHLSLVFATIFFYYIFDLKD